MSGNGLPSGFFSMPPPPPPPPAAAQRQHQQPPLYNYNATATTNAVSSSSSSSPRKRPRREEHCDACDLTFDSHTAFAAHVKSHTKCRVCSFSAAPKIVKAHYQSAHGKYSASGFKTVTVAVPGCPVQQFRILVGNHPDDVKQWVEERRRRFPRVSQSQSAQPQETQQSEEKGITSLLAGYGSSSDEEEDGEVQSTKQSPQDKKESLTCVQEEEVNNREPPVVGNQAPNKRVCLYFSRYGKCRNGDSCGFRHEAPLPKQQQQRTHHKPPKRETLLSKLLANDVRRERVLTLQLLHHVFDTDFLTKKKP